MDREAHKRELEKTFREWWAAGNETIFGPLNSPSMDTSSRNSSSEKEDADEGCKTRTSDISVGESSGLSIPQNEHAVTAYHSSVRSSSFGTLEEGHWLRNGGLKSSSPTKKLVHQQINSIPLRSKANSPPKVPTTMPKSKSQGTPHMTKGQSLQKGLLTQKGSSLQMVRKDIKVSFSDRYLAPLFNCLTDRYCPKGWSLQPHSRQTRYVLRYEHQSTHST